MVDRLWGISLVVVATENDPFPNLQVGEVMISSLRESCLYLVIAKVNADYAMCKL